MGLENILNAMGVGCVYSGVVQGTGYALKHLSKHFGEDDDLTKWFNIEGALIGMVAAYMTYQTNVLSSPDMELLGSVGVLDAISGGIGALIGCTAGILLPRNGPGVGHYAKLGLLIGVFTYPFAELAHELLKTYPA